MSMNVLSPSGEYALRATICLAGSGDAWVPARDLAETASVPPAYLSKVLRRLVSNGILLAQKGHHGGFRLARAPGEIRVSDVLGAADAGMEENHCAFGWERCNHSAPCPLHDVYGELRAHCHTWSRGHTLADIDLSRIPAAPR